VTIATGHRMIRVNVASAIVERAELELRRPVLPLRSYLGCFWSIATTAGRRLRTLPDACTTLVVECRQSERPKAFLVGPRLTPANRAPGAGHLLLGVRLQPGVAFALTRRPVHQIVDRRTHLSAILRERSRSGGLAQLAVELGYYGQPHLTNEVAQFSAVSLGRMAGRGMADFSNTRCT